MNNLDNATYVAHYSPKAVSMYRTRGIISTIVWVSVAAFVIPFVASLRSEFSWWTVVVAVSMLFPVIVSLIAALNAKSKYGADNGLAIAITPEGIVLPNRGLIQWGNMVGVREGGTGVVTGNIGLYVFSTWLGTRETRLIDIYVNGGVEEIDRIASSTGLDPQLLQTLGAGATRQEPWKGFRVRSAYVQGLGDPAFNQALDAALTAAHAQGIPTKW